MTKFEPLDAADSINQIHVEPIENGYLVKRYTMFSSAIIHCTLPDLPAVFESALEKACEFKVIKAGSVSVTGTMRA